MTYHLAILSTKEYQQLDEKHNHQTLWYKDLGDTFVKFYEEEPDIGYIPEFMVREVLGKYL